MSRRGPWIPERAWADPFIASLALLIVLMLSSLHRQNHRASAPPPQPASVSIQGQVMDVALGGARFMGGATPAGAGRGGKGWDAALMAVYAAERGETSQARALVKDLPEPGGNAFRSVLAWAYEGAGTPPPPGITAHCATALGNGCAARLLEARLVQRAGGDPKPLQAQAQAWVLPRFLGLMAAGLGCMALFLGGLVYLIILLASRKPAPAMPAYGMAGRAVLIVLLGWFAVHLSAGVLMAGLVKGLPFLRSLFLPLTYLLHASLGTTFLCLAEGIGPRELLARVAPGRHGRSLLAGGGWFALAFMLVASLAIILSPFLRNAEPPQRELLEVIRLARGPFAVGAMFLTVAVVAPAFEELMFRGFLLPWLGARFQGRFSPRGAWALATLVTAAAFGAMHLQPLALPTLCTLGAVLGFAFLRTGNLLTAILVHGLWNGSIFLLMKTLA
jgi:membrane protease YdiL (CAAX protease family)